MKADAKDIWTTEWEHGINQSFRVQVLKYKFILNCTTNTQIHSYKKENKTKKE